MNSCLRGSEAGELSGIFLQATDITKNKCSNKFMRNLTHTATSLHGEIDWEKIWLLGDEFHLNKKEVLFKTTRKIYPAIKTLEQFKIYTYSSVFCGVEDETICHMLYYCVQPGTNHFCLCCLFKKIILKSICLSL